MVRKLFSGLLFSLMMFAGCAPVAHAQEAKILDWPTVSAAGPTTALNLTQYVTGSGESYVSADQTVSVVLGTGTNTTCTWQLQASDDGVNWYSVLTSQTCTASGFLAVQQIPLRRLRVNVTSYTGTASLTFHWTGSN